MVIFSSEDVADEVAEGGVVPFLAFLEFFCKKAIEVGSSCELYWGAVGDVALDDNFAGSIASAGAAGDLDYELEGAFGCTEVLDM